MAGELESAKQALDRRGITIDLESPTGTDGATSTCQVNGHLDRADAADLEAAISDLAHQLLLAGSTETLEVRRSHALGLLARREAPAVIPDQTPEHHTAEEWDDLDHELVVSDHAAGTTADESCDAEAPAPTAPAATTIAVRKVVLYVHLTDEALRTGEGLVRVEGHPHPVTVDQVRAWCASPLTRTHISVRPVIDLIATIAVGSYEIPNRLTEQTVLRDRTCVPALRPGRPALRLRPHPPPRRRRTHLHHQPRRAVPAPPPAQDTPPRLDPPDAASQHLLLDHPHRAPAPPRPRRHPPAGRAYVSPRTPGRDGRCRGPTDVPAPSAGGGSEHTTHHRKDPS